MPYQRGDEHWSRVFPEKVPRGDGHYRVRQKTPEERFWEKVDKTGDCWEWTGCIVPAGYGRFSIKHPEKKGVKLIRAHRFCWEIVNGPLRDGELVLHKCDNRKCVRPSHLFIGSNDDNSKDMVRKDRQAIGESNGSAKLNKRLVVEMREVYREGGMSTVELAKAYGISQCAAWSVVRRKTWSHVD